MDQTLNVISRYIEISAISIRDNISNINRSHYGLLGEIIDLARAGKVEELVSLHHGNNIADERSPAGYSIWDCPSPASSNGDQFGSLFYELEDIIHSVN